MRKSAPVGAFPGAWQQAHVCQAQQGPFLVPSRRHMEGQPWQGPFLAPGEAGASTWGERGCNVGSTPCMPLNSDALLLWQTRFPP